MLPALATIEDFRDWELSAPTNVPRALAILAAASNLIRGHTGRVWIDAAGVAETELTEVQLEAVRTVCLTVASRVYNNPHGNTTQTTGPFSYGVAAWSSLGLALTDDEKAQLGTTPASGSPGLWSLRVVAPRAAMGRRYGYEFWETYEGDRRL